MPLRSDALLFQHFPGGGNRTKQFHGLAKVLFV